MFPHMSIIFKINLNINNTEFLGILVLYFLGLCLNIDAIGG